MLETNQKIGIGVAKGDLQGELPLQILMHVQDLGDRTFQSGDLAGSPGLYVDGFQIKITAPASGLILQYMAHTRNGDTPWVNEGAFCGTRGQNLPLEGIAIRLTGADAAAYSVQYRADLEVVGGTAAVVDGVYLGTRGQGLAVDGIEVRVRPRSAWAEDLGSYDTNFHWNNWDQLLPTVFPYRYCPTTLEQLVAIVTHGTAGGKQVRAVGSGWAYSEVAVPHDWLVETHKLSGFLGGPFAGTLSGPLPAKPGQELLFHVEAGITIHALNLLLDKRELALLTAGGSSGQTLAGALSTGTHGGDFDLPPVADMVRAIQLVAAGGEVYWIERGKTSSAVSTPAEVRTLAPYIDPTRIIYDDHFFDSVLVSMGSMGIIYSLVIATRPRYWLQQTSFTSSWLAMKPLLADGALFSISPWVLAAANLPSNQAVGVPPANNLGPPRFVQLVMTPNTVIGDKGDRVCSVTLRCEIPEPPPPNPNAPAAPPTPDFLTALQRIDDYRPILSAFAGLLGSAIPVVSVGLSFLGALAPMLEAVLPFASLVLGTGVVVAESALAIGFPQVSALALTLAARSKQDPPMNLQAAAVFIFNTAAGLGIPGILPAFNKLILTAMQPPGSQNGQSFAIMDTSVDAHGVDANTQPNHITTDSVELFFDASNTAALADTIDQLLATIQQVGDFGGYVSLRFTGPTAANLGMQQVWSRNCAVEVTLISGLNGNLPLLAKLQDFTIGRGGRLHWGQLNGELNAADVRAQYPNLGRWHFARAQVTRNFSLATFDNAFTLRCGFDGPPLHPSATIVTVGQGIISHLSPLTHQSTGNGTFHVNTVDLGLLAKVTWNGAVPGDTFDGTATVHFDSVQPGIPQTISVEVTDVFGTTVKATAVVPVIAGTPLPIDPNNPLHTVHT